MSTKKIRITVILAAAFCALLLGACTPKKNTAVILYTNDTHTYLDGEGMSFASVAALKKELMEKGENVLLVDAGDAAQGTSYGMFDEGKTVIHVMNEAGYDAAAPGNHVFDYGFQGGFELISRARYPYVCCNLYDTFNECTYLEPYVILPAGGKKIAFVGILTPDTKLTGFEDVRMLGASDPEELYSAVQSAINGARAEGADYVIAIGHTGVDAEVEPWRSIDIIGKVRGLDAYIDAHSHTVMACEMITDADGKEIPLTQTGTAFANIGKMTIAADGKITTELINGYEKRDEKVAKLETDWVRKVKNDLETKFAFLPFDFALLDPEDPSRRLIRFGEIALGDFVADAYFYDTQKIWNTEADLALLNSGAVKNGIPAGDVSFMSCMDALPYGNELCMIETTGQNILDALEWGAKKIGVIGSDGKEMESSSLLQVSGLTYTIDATIPSTIQTDAEGNWAGPPTGERRVRDVMVYNRHTGAYEPLDPERYYTVSGQAYILEICNSGFNMFKKDTTVLQSGKLVDYTALARYSAAFDKNAEGFPEITSLTGPLSAFPYYGINYEDPEGAGRIHIIRSP